MPTVSTSGRDGAPPGFYGKLPARGDFLKRGLPGGFVDPWDAWTSGVLAGAAETLGDAWRRLYMRGAVWRFALSDSFGDWIGVMVPSVDSVGRLYPVTIARQQARGGAIAAAADRAWFDRVEDLAIAALAPETDPEALARELGAAADPAGAAPPAAVTAALPFVRAVSEAEAGATSADDRAHAAGCTTPWLLWTEGADAIAPAVALSPGPPSPAQAVALFDGDWTARGWTQLGARDD